MKSTSFGTAIKYCCVLLLAVFSTAGFAQDKPNILVIWGDDIGNTNISANTHGLMGYRTPSGPLIGMNIKF